MITLKSNEKYTVEAPAPTGTVEATFLGVEINEIGGQVSLVFEYLGIPSRVKLISTRPGMVEPEFRISARSQEPEEKTTVAQ